VAVTREEDRKGEEKRDGTGGRENMKMGGNVKERVKGDIEVEKEHCERKRSKEREMRVKRKNWSREIKVKT
jgi:hypothetical protein